MNFALKIEVFNTLDLYITVCNIVYLQKKLTLLKGDDEKR